MNKEGHKTPMLTLCAVAVLFSMARWGEPVLALDPRKAITQYVHDVWQTKDGLPQSSITAIIQTRDGYLWLGTFGGLVRFDGMQFTVFDTSNTQALRSKRILALFEDRDGAHIGWPVVFLIGGRCHARAQLRRSIGIAPRPARVAIQIKGQ
jgi:ligand-binding sensor domain-containing protein